jgi:Ca2+-binding RTX toxin-like protein
VKKRFVLGKRAALLLSSSLALVALVLASGVALAEVIECRGTTSCFGTNSADTMRGTLADNQMFGQAGGDAMVGKRGADYIRGDRGADTIRGNGAGDRFLWGGGFDAGGNYDDGADDVVHGGRGADTIVGGFAKRGVDRIYGGKGDDTVNAAQRDSGTGAAITREAIDCGAGTDTVYYDEGKDEVKSCEIKNPGTSTSGRMALRAMNEDGLGGNGVPLPSPSGSEGARALR